MSQIPNRNSLNQELCSLEIMSMSILTLIQSNRKEKFLLRKNYCEKLLRESEDRTLNKILLKKLHEGDLVYEPDKSASKDCHSPIVEEFKPSRSYDLLKRSGEDSDVSPVRFHLFKPNSGDKVMKVRDKILEDEICLNDEEKFKLILNDFIEKCSNDSKSLFSHDLISRDYIRRISKCKQEVQINKILKFDYNSKSEETKTTKDSRSRSKNKKFKIVSGNKANIVIDSNAKINLFFKKPTKKGGEVRKLI